MYKFRITSWMRPGEATAPISEPLTGELVGIWGSNEDQGDFSGVIRGGLGTWCKARLPDVGYDVLCAEFGTTNILAVISALHHENRAHLWGAEGESTTVAAKARLREVFAPKSAKWRGLTLERGIAIVQRACGAGEGG